jgi:hypothetical protein
MKMTFEVPDEIAAVFKQTVPAGQRSAVAARFMAVEGYSSAEGEPLRAL